MSVSGLCQICETREANHQCDNCGALVCDTDYERGVGICVQCAGEGDEDGAGEIHRV